MTDVDELRGLLAFEYAQRRISFLRETVYAWTRPSDSSAVDEWSMGVDPVDEPGGTHAEWTITWHQHIGRAVWQLNMFGDALVGVVATDLLTLLGQHTDSGPDELRAALLADGWVDRTRRTREETS